MSLIEEKGMAKWCRPRPSHTQVIHIALADSKFSNSFPDHRSRAKHVWKVSSSSELKHITCSSLSHHSSMMISNQTYMKISSYLMYPLLKTLEIHKTKHVWRFLFISCIRLLWSKWWGCLNIPYHACIVKFSMPILSSWHLYHFPYIVWAEWWQYFICALIIWRGTLPSLTHSTWAISLPLRHVLFV